MYGAPQQLSHVVVLCSLIYNWKITDIHKQTYLFILMNCKCRDRHLNIIHFQKQKVLWIQLTEFYRKRVVPGRVWKKGRRLIIHYRTTYRTIHIHCIYIIGCTMYIVHVLDGARIVVYRINNAHVLNRQKHSLYSVQCTMYLFFNWQKTTVYTIQGRGWTIGDGLPRLRVRPFFKPYRAPPLFSRTRWADFTTPFVFENE